ncbi:MAE_28990/MAE_18760 family HEPN-like nuclease [Metaclostridioides mangenotii]|uniref:RiboL-PSP-HEPN domain-containing protein n=1 Tax=Metaclostridioides mangenotii TaxID=1540 RepID=A0ABS4E6Z6_9FIRM|nr:MAE_28990/MAE_18760 family HEPN-like nuclease [Clostridioides mangenotii]MBP1853682.1 hypothetical protein [Clostridioides mangenotii]
MNSYNEVDLETFLAKLDEELSIRKKEIIKMKDIVDSTNDNLSKLILMKNFYVSIYAHYEGYFKSTFYLFLEFMKTVVVDRDNINLYLIALASITSFEQHVSQNVQSNRLIEIIDNIYTNNSSNIFNIRDKDKFILNHSTIESIYKLLGIKADSLDFPFQELGVLYGRRNVLAHGEVNSERFNVFSSNNPSKISDKHINNAYVLWFDAYDLVLSSLDKIKNTFFNYINDKIYLKEIEYIADSALEVAITSEV